MNDMYTPGNTLNFKERVQRQTSDLDSGTRGLVVIEELGVDTVHSDEIVHVGKEDLQTDDMSPYNGITVYKALMDD